MTPQHTRSWLMTLTGLVLGLLISVITANIQSSKALYEIAQIQTQMKKERDRVDSLALESSLHRKKESQP